MSPQVANAHALIQRLQENNIYFLQQGNNSNGFEALYVYSQTERRDEIVVGEISIEMGVVNLEARSH